jgi:hypothetical protein
MPSGVSRNVDTLSLMIRVRAVYLFLSVTLFGFLSAAQTEVKRPPQGTTAGIDRPDPKVISAYLIKANATLEAMKTITIGFEAGKQKTLKADSYALKDESLELHVYTKDSTKLQVSTSFKANSIRWAVNNEGSYIIGSTEHRYD